MRQLKEITRSVEVWIFGAFGALILAACLDRPAERSAPARPASPVGAVPETELVQPDGAIAQPAYVVYVVGKRPGAAAKRAARANAG